MDAAIDRWVWYAGWADKVTAVLGWANPVAGPYFDFSVPEPTGVVAVLAPQESALLGLVSVVAPVVATGNTCVVVASEARPLPAVTLSEVLATSDVPGGVVNLLTGFTAELAPWLAAHRDVNALDLTGADPAQAVELEQAAAENVKRVLPAPAGRAGLDRGPGHPAAGRVPGDQDRLAPAGRLRQPPRGAWRRTGHEPVLEGGARRCSRRRRWPPAAPPRRRWWPATRRR